MLSSSAAAACLLRRRCSPLPLPLPPPSPPARLILDSTAGLLIRTVYTPQHGASPSTSHHDTPSPPVHALPSQHGTIPSSSHHSTPSPPGYVYPHEHGIRPSLSHHATPSPSAHPVHSPGVGDEHTSKSRRPPAPHRTSSTRSSTNRLRSSIPPAIEEIPDFFRPLTAPTKGKNPLIHLIVEHGLLHPSSVAVGKMSLVFKSGYLKEGWKWEYVPQSKRDIYWLRWKDLQMSFAIYDAAIRYTGNIYLIAKKRIKPFYLIEEVFEHYKRMRATDEAFKKKSEQMSSNRKSEVGGPVTGISLHSAGGISARQHGDTLAELTRRLEEMFQTPDTSIDEDAVYLEVVPEVKGRVYRLGSQGYHRSISLGEASSSRGPAQEQMQRDKMERQEENREMQDCLARMDALLMQHLGIRPHVPPTPLTPLSPGTERSGPESDDQPGHFTTDIALSQSAHLVCAAVAFDIGVAYREGVDKASLILLGFGWDTLC
ncbi:hypothetical protein Scep_017050 [Stephania cephalantha]|uniref:Uncharacterized protein n=1 Tax=Stephania cephalantha TaxID=152367 RepID=A0AAP0NT81_9MAGN